VLARVTPIAIAFPVLALCLLAAGCGGDRAARTAAVGSYIEQVNATQLKLAQPLLAVSRANRDFASRKKQADPVALRLRLERSERKIRALRAELAGVTAPAEVRTLRTLMLALVDRELGLTREVAQLVAFIPAFSHALAPIAPAGPALKAALGSGQPVAAKAAALDRYHAVVEVVLARLAPLHPPPSSVPVYESQVQTLRQVRAAVAGLAQALRRQQRAQIAHFLRQFDLAAVANQSLAAQRAQISAVKGYNARIRSLDAIAMQIARERSRVQQQLR
jgi:hypothetical protein